MVYAIITAAGRGVRFGSKEPKQFIALNNKPVLFHTIHRFLSISFIDNIIVVLPQKGFNKYKKSLLSTFDDFKINLISGGKNRSASVWNALKKVKNNSWVFIHDGVRPNFSDSLINRIFSKRDRTKGVIPVVPLPDTLVRLVNGIEYIERKRLMMIQTPQLFLAQTIKKAYEYADTTNFTGTDESSIAHHYGIELIFVDGERGNIKITVQSDLEFIKEII